MSYIFQRIAQAGVQAGVGSKTVEEARTWYRTAARNVRDVNANQLMNDGSRLKPSKTISMANIGQLLMFFYDPKTKAKLPYYDRFPLVLPIDASKSGAQGERGFLGLNLHYLSPYQRAKFFDGLYNIAQVAGPDDNRRFRLSYQFLKTAGSLSMFKPCIKHYLMPYVRSKFYIVPSDEWDIALMLPTERFEQGGAKGGRVGGPISKQKIWNDSSRKGRAIRRPRRRK